jgi:hypothetical protein
MFSTVDQIESASVAVLLAGVFSPSERNFFDHEPPQQGLMKLSFTSDTLHPLAAKNKSRRAGLSLSRL